MNVDFVKLGKLVESQNVELSMSTKHNLTLKELTDRYRLRLDEQLRSLKKELDELELNIARLYQKNSVLHIMLDEKFGKRINKKLYDLNIEKVHLNETTISHLQYKKEQILKTIEKTNIYKSKTIQI